MSTAGQRHQAADRRHRASTSSSSAAPTCSTAACAATSTTTRWNRRTCPTSCAAHRRHAGDGGSQQADLRLRLRHRRTDPPQQGVVLRLVLDPGRAAGAPRRRAGRPHAAEEPEREGELAGDAARTWSASSTSTASRSRTTAAPASPASLFDAPTATFHQDNAYTDNPLHGLWKIARRPRRSARTCSCRRSTRYYNTGFVLDADGRPGPAGGPQLRRPRSRTARSNQSLERAPAEDRERRRCNSFFNALGASHDLKYGFGWRTRRRDDRHAVARQRHPRAAQNAPTTFRRRCSARGSGAQPRQLPRLLRRRHHREEPRDDRSRRPLRPPGRRGAAERHAGEPGVPERRARASNFAGYDDAVHVEQLLAARRRDLRARRRRARPSRARATAATPDSSTPARVGVHEPELDGRRRRPIAGSTLNGDHFAQANEVQLEPVHHARRAASTRRTRRR